MIINNVLLINPGYYASQEEDMEYLYKTRDIDNIMKAAQKCEKFHSYFHYEESFFNTVLGQIKGNDRVLLEKAVKLSPVNKVALNLLLALEPERKSDIEIKLRAVEKLQSELVRPHATFLDYMIFATENPDLERADYPDFTNYWALYEKYQKFGSVEVLEHAMHDLEARHIMYHKEAAKIYHAAYMFASNTGDEELARFAITKARNLDPSVI